MHNGAKGTSFQAPSHRLTINNLQLSTIFRDSLDHLSCIFVMERSGDINAGEVSLFLDRRDLASVFEESLVKKVIRRSLLETAVSGF